MRILSERLKNLQHEFIGHYSEKRLMNAAREFLEEHQIELVVMVSAGQKFRYSTILGRTIFEIMAKIKSNILAVPE